MHRLKKVDFHNNFITSVEPRVFDESANLSSLSTIELSYNDITELEPWPAIRAQHRPMTVFMRHNRISNFTNALRWRFNCSSPRLFETLIDVHDNQIEHITDAVYGWNIDGQLPLEHLKIHFREVAIFVGVIFSDAPSIS